MELSEVLRRRRMVRRFRDTPISAEALRRVLASAQRAPSAGFTQGTALLVLDHREQVEEFWRLTDPWGRKARGSTLPPVVVIPLSDKQAYLDRYSEPDKQGLGMDVEEGWPVPYWDLDAAMTVMLMLLAAVDEGLGAWYFGIFQRERELLHGLGVPAGLKPIGAVALGHPAPEDRPRGSSTARSRRSFDEVVHWGRWQGRLS
jgi:nitroreductase